MDAKHTPGPWRVEKLEYPHDEDVSFEITAHPFNDENAVTPVICQTFMREKKTEFRQIEADEANVRLIAAAPELLKALQELYRVVNGTLQGYGILDPAMKQAAVAIAKAEKCHRAR